MANHHNVCSICAHPDRVRIETLAISGAADAVVARKFAVSYYALRRHLKKHVSPERKALLVAGPSAKMEELALRGADVNEGVLEYFVALRSVLFSRLAAAAEAGDDNGVAVLSGRAIEVLRHLGRLAGVLTEGSTYNVTNNFLIHPMFVELQAMLLQELRAYPEARQAVISGLRRLEARAARPAIEGAIDDVRIAAQ